MHTRRTGPLAMVLVGLLLGSGCRWSRDNPLDPHGTRSMLPEDFPQNFVYIPPGSFFMGSPADERCRDKTSEDLHLVTLNHGFGLQSTEVTQAEFQARRGYNRSYNLKSSALPVEQVAWHEAAAYCNALSTEAGLDLCYSCKGSKGEVDCTDASAYAGAAIQDCPGYRLPTEAEWEYAYRAGSSTAYYNGTNGVDCAMVAWKDATADAIAWYAGNADTQTRRVGLKTPNAWGLYDMAGNVSEWCQDRFLSALGSSSKTNPLTDNAHYAMRVLRGGSYKDLPRGLRAAARQASDPRAAADPATGFRCARTLLSTRRQSDLSPVPDYYLKGEKTDAKIKLDAKPDSKTDSK